MSRASSWNTVEVVRPQPGQAATCGAKMRKPMVCRISRATLTSSVRSPPGSGVSETRIVSPMPSCKQHAERGGRGDDALRAHAGLGQAEMDRVVGALGEHAIDGDQVLHRRDLRREDDAVAREADLLGARRRKQRRAHHRLAHHRARVERRRRWRRSRPSAWSAAPGRASPSWRRCAPPCRGGSRSRRSGRTARRACS